MVSIVSSLGVVLLKLIVIEKMFAVPVAPPKVPVIVSPAFASSDDPEEESVVNVIVPVKIPVFTLVSVRVNVIPSLSVSDVIVTGPRGSASFVFVLELGLVTVTVAVSLNLYSDASNSTQVEITEPARKKISSLSALSSLSSFQTMNALLPADVSATLSESPVVPLRFCELPQKLEPLSTLDLKKISSSEPTLFIQVT